MIRRCTCNDEFQDKKYGAGMRVHNPSVGHDGGVVPRCTKCLSEKAEEKKVKEK